MLLFKKLKIVSFQGLWISETNAIGSHIRTPPKSEEKYN
jgi:hypothetical protein